MLKEFARDGHGRVPLGNHIVVQHLNTIFGFYRRASASIGAHVSITPAGTDGDHSDA